MEANMPKIVLFTYPESVWGGKVVTYLNIRRINYTVCRQPMTWPREDLTNLLGINYRRIPLMAIGRDIYFDTRLIFEKLEQLFQGGTTLGAKTATDHALEKLFRDWAELSLFVSAVFTMPPDLPQFQDAKFVQDRTELSGFKFTPEDQARRRPSGLVEMRIHFELLEELLSDGREWLSGSDDIQLVDIHATVGIDWLNHMSNGLPDEFFGQAIYPHTFAFMKRYRERINSAQGENSVELLSGQDAVRGILQSGLAEDLKGVTNDPTKFVAGQTVRVSRTDDASSSIRHFDTGKLVTLTTQEVVISRTAGSDDIEIRLHFPRWKFNVAEYHEARLA